MPGIFRLRILSVSDHATFADPEEGWLIEVPDDATLEVFDAQLGALIGWSDDMEDPTRYRWFLAETPLAASTPLDKVFRPGCHLLTAERAPAGATELYDLWLERRLTPAPQTGYPRELDAHHPNAALERQPAWSIRNFETPDEANLEANGEANGEANDEASDEEARNAAVAATIFDEVTRGLPEGDRAEAEQVARELVASLREVLVSRDPLSPASTLRLAKAFREDQPRLGTLVADADAEGRHTMLVHLLQVMAQGELTDHLARALQASTSIPMDSRLADLMLTVMPELARLDPAPFLDLAETLTEVDRIDLFALVLLRAGVNTPRAAQLYRRAIASTPLPTMVAQLAFDAAEAGASLVVPALEERLDELPDIAGLSRVPYEGQIVTAWAIQELGASLTPERIARLQALGPSARSHPYWSKLRLDASAGTYRASERPGRNDPCWCGSEKKYKKCHMRQDQPEP